MKNAEQKAKASQRARLDLAVITRRLRPTAAPPSWLMSANQGRKRSIRQGFVNSVNSKLKAREASGEYGRPSVIWPFASDQGFCRSTPKSTSCCSIGPAGRSVRTSAGQSQLAPILDRLGLDRSNWVKTVREFGRMFKQAAGRASSLARAAPRCSRRWFQGRTAAQAAFV